MVHPTDALWYNEQVELGFNYRMTDFQAALLLSQLKKLPAFEQRRKEIHKRYNEAFGKMPELILQKEIPESDTTWHLYVLHLNLENLNCDRRQFSMLCMRRIPALRCITCRSTGIPIMRSWDIRRDCAPMRRSITTR